MDLLMFLATLKCHKLWVGVRVEEASFKKLARRFQSFLDSLPLHKELI